MAYLTIEDLSFTYPGAREKALDSISLEITEGEFLLLCGKSGCGKTTLLRLLKKELQPMGNLSGEIFYEGKFLSALDDRRSAAEFGFVMQDPDGQIVTDKVWHELAFGLESLGYPSDLIRRRVAEVASFFGIADLYNKKTAELSGGSKQLLNLASVMAMSPKILLLDEPTAQLDPIAASEFIAALKKLSTDLGVTVILAEHRLEELFSLADRVVLMEKGKILLCGRPHALAEGLKGHALYRGLPTSVRIYHALGKGGTCPLTVREGRAYLTDRFDNSCRKVSDEDAVLPKDEALSVKNAWYRYEKKGEDILKGLDLTLKKGELLAVLGANGVGKTTLLKLLCGIAKCYRGNVTVFGKKLSELSRAFGRNPVACLPQNPRSVFLRSTVLEDLLEVSTLLSLSKEEMKKKIAPLAEKLGFSHLYDRHPYDLSGGEAQKVALAKLLLTDPEIILLDEPTKGLDPQGKEVLADILATLKGEGKTILLVTHDVEFSAEYADRVALLFDGAIVSVAKKRDFFSENSFYTTAAHRMTKGIFDNAVTADDVVTLCLENREKEVACGE